MKLDEFCDCYVTVRSFDCEKLKEITDELPKQTKKRNESFNVDLIDYEVILEYNSKSNKIKDLLKKYKTRIINKSFRIGEKISVESTTNKQIKSKYPIYIISKGRWSINGTARYLDSFDHPYTLVVEPKEYELYKAQNYKGNILVAPQNYSELGQGGIPVRNFVWGFSKSQNESKHWILDDNITNYKRISRGVKNHINSGEIFTEVEKFTDENFNIKMSGHHYSFFINASNPPKTIWTINSRVYSSILLDNSIFGEFDWRGKYNEDTDLSLRILKKGYATVMSNVMVANKKTTMTTKGGNTDTIYSVENAHLLKSQSLVDQHPDVAKLSFKFKRWHHHVNYKSFSNNPLNN